MVCISEILGTLEYLSEPYNHEGELESLKRSGIFWSIVFGVLWIVFGAGAAVTMKKPTHGKDIA